MPIASGGLSVPPRGRESEKERGLQVLQEWRLQKGAGLRVLSQL